MQDEHKTVDTIDFALSKTDLIINWILVGTATILTIWMVLL